MSLLRPVKHALTKDPAYVFAAHPQSPYQVAGAGTARFEPGFGGIGIRSGWRRGLPRRYTESRIQRTDENRRAFRPLQGMEHLDVDSVREILGGLRPFTPVITIDGVPAATGFGEGVIAVPAGRHLVQLQSGASGPYRSVDVRPGEVVALDAVTTKLRHLRCLEGVPGDSYGDMALGPRNQVRIRDGAMFRSLAAGGAAAFLALGLLALAGAFGILDVDFDSAAVIVPVLAAYVVVAVAFGLWENRPGPPAGPPHGPEPHSGAQHRVLDPHDSETPQAAPGRAVLRVHAVYRQEHNRADAGPGEPTGRTLKELLDKRAAARAANWDATGEPAPPRPRPWVTAPRILVNGRAVPAVWGRNEYQLPPGPATVDISVPPPGVPLDEGAEIQSGDAMRVNVRLDASQPVELGAYARIRMTSGLDGTALKEYRGAMRRA